jgi:hypothetical protein
MPPHRWLLPNLMPNSEEPVAMRAGALREGALLMVGWSILLAPVRRPTTSSGPHRQTSRLNGMPPPARTDAATCASRTLTPCAGMGTKRRVKIERSTLLLFSAPLRRGSFFAARQGAPGCVGCGDWPAGRSCRDMSPMTASYFPRLATEQAPARVVAIKIVHWGERWRTNRRFKSPACSTSAG